MVLIRAMSTSTYIAIEPWLMAEVKMKNLLKKPANGGIPASENMASIIAHASQGLVFDRPL